MGIFDKDTDLFTEYDVELVFRDKIMGGIPGDPALIEAWLRRHAGEEHAEQHQRLVIQTLREMGADVDDEIEDFDERVQKAVESVAAMKQTNIFKANGHGPYIESRQVKAMLKEVTNILFAGDRWGKTRKGPKSFLAERVFVEPLQIELGRNDPDGYDLFVGHVSDASGKRSTLTYYAFVLQPTIRFRLKVTDDCIDPKHWPMIWVHAQENGLGALRSQGHGTFDITKFDQVGAN